jgi:MFS family permease
VAARHWTGPLRFATVDLLIAVIGLITGAIAIVEVSVVSYASDLGSSALAGILFAAMAAGSTLGGLVFAMHGSQRPARDLLPYLCLLSAAGFALLPAAGSNTWLLFVLLAVSNLAMSPAFACVYTFLSDVAPGAESAETFTWASSSNFVAISGGTALGGILLTHADRWVAYLVAVAILLVATGTALRARSVALRSAEPAPSR